jgi:hypothetical protein
MHQPHDVLVPEIVATVLAHWQERLRLQDWTLIVRVARLFDLGNATLGDIDISKVKRQALIRLLHPDDFEGQLFHFDGEVRDWELTLVHELVHIHFDDTLPADWMNDRMLLRAVERAVDAIAKALVRD